MDEFSRHAIRVSVAEICQIIGWTAIQSSPLEILTDILQEYITGLAKIAARYALLFGQSEPNLNHVALAFKDMGVSISELEEYVTYVESSSVLEVPKYPIPKESHLNHLKPGSREVVTRPFHIHEHLPPMHPHLEDEEVKSPLSVEVPTLDGHSPLSSPKGIFKKPGDPISSDPRRGRSFVDDEIRPLREISSVMMTTSGFLSHAREGKLPEARTLPIEYCNPPSPEPTASQPEPEETEPPQPPPIPQPPVETKTEKKKKNKPADGSAKKPDKENKIKDELAPEAKDPEDEPKGKKLVTAKETSKLKALKTGALKMQQKPPSPSPSPPPQKKAKLSPNSSLLNSKLSKVKSPKNDKRPQSPLVKDPVGTSVKDSTPDVDIKLPSEPDKQKLNIFKKITKVKEDVDDIKLDLDHRDINSPHADSSAATHRKPFGDSQVKDDVPQAHLDESPSTSVSMVAPSVIEKSPEVSKVSETKKKKKDKQKEKKDLCDKDKDSPKSKHHLEDNSIKGKSLGTTDAPTPDIETAFSAAESPSLAPAGELAHPWSNPQNPSTIPPLIISTLGSNSVATKNSDMPSSSGQQSSVSPSSTSTSLLTDPSLTPDTNKDNNLLIQKRKDRKKDKKLKDKIKKKKEKKVKNKIKDKSERKKLKLEKKEKAKLKLKKGKKEKKKDKEAVSNKGFEQSHIAEDVLNTLTPWGSDSLPPKKAKIEGEEESSTQVPKITFKLGPASPSNTPEPSTPRKIVIKPVVKKEEDVAGSNVANSNAQTVPKAQATSSKLKSNKGGKSGHLNKNEPPEKPPTFLPSQIILPGVDPFPAVPKWEADPNKVWICPACSHPDDGSPMIACDKCDLWFHWICVGIVENIESDWYCSKCISKKDDGQTEKKKKHRKKKN